MRALDLYCGAGGATRGLMQTGFHVTGVDIEPQPRYCGDAFVRADALRYLATTDLSPFDLIWASPPCPRFTALRTAPGAKGDAHPDLITPTRALLQRSGKPWVIENVAGARKYLIDPIVLCGTAFGLETPPYKTAPGGFELRRHRLFEVAGFTVSAPPCLHSGRPVIGVYGGHCRDRRRKPGTNHRSGSNLPWPFAFAAMGVPPWSMTLTSLCDGIPPAFAKFIAEAFLMRAKASPDTQARQHLPQGAAAG
jgi:DNA (cytosine-5)-methyltransferase 1